MQAAAIPRPKQKVDETTIAVAIDIRRLKLVNVLPIIVE
jgi:hypothetical protein